MKFTIAHTNLNVFNMERSLAFYKEALQLDVVRRIKSDDGSFELAFLTDNTSVHQLELTWLRDKAVPYELGDNETHIAFTINDYEAAYALHKKMGCVCYVNDALGVYFIEDPDGYWLEILPEKL